MKMTSAEFTKLTIQEVADMLLSNDLSVAACKGKVGDEMYTLKVEVIKDDKD